MNSVLPDVFLGEGREGVLTWQNRLVFLPSGRGPNGELSDCDVSFFPPDLGRKTFSIDHMKLFYRELLRCSVLVALNEM